jgi:hypothetical protein
MAELEIAIEPQTSHPPGGGLEKRISQALTNAFALRVPVRLVEPGSLPRFEAAFTLGIPACENRMTYEAVAAGVVDYGQTSSAIIEDASYVRLRNISLSYTVPPRKLRAVSMSNLSFYISATNLLTFTNYTGYDPEANTFGQNTTIVGIDQGGYPQAKTFQFGVSATF